MPLTTILCCLSVVIRSLKQKCLKRSGWIWCGEYQISKYDTALLQVCDTTRVLELWHWRVCQVDVRICKKATSPQSWASILQSQPASWENCECCSWFLSSSASTYGFLSLIFNSGDLARSSAWGPVYKDFNLPLKKVEYSEIKVCGGNEANIQCWDCLSSQYIFKSRSYKGSDLGIV